MIRCNFKLSNPALKYRYSTQYFHNVHVFECVAHACTFFPHTNLENMILFFIIEPRYEGTAPSENENMPVKWRRQKAHGVGEVTWKGAKKKFEKVVDWGICYFLAGKQASWLNKRKNLPLHENRANIFCFWYRFQSRKDTIFCHIFCCISASWAYFVRRKKQTEIRNQQDS